MEIKNSEHELRATMLKNISIIKSAAYLSRNKIALILRASFRNYRLRFVEIDGRSYPANSKLELRDDLCVPFANPHEEDVRISFSEGKRLLFIETMQLITNPLIADQVTDRDAMIGSLLNGHMHCNHTKPDEKIPEWKNSGEEITLKRISSIQIEEFWDRPTSWKKRTDYTAYRIIIKTKS